MRCLISNIISRSYRILTQTRSFSASAGRGPASHGPDGGSTGHDVIIVGGNGAFGSSAAYHLSLKGARVLALDMHPPGHPWGSSHGHTRIIRLAYFEGPEYVDLLKRSYNLFLELQEQSGQEIFVKTGMLDVGATFDKSLASAKLHNLPHEILSADEVNKRYPGYSVPEGLMSLYQPDGGLLTPEKIIKLHSELAVRHGARMVSSERVVSWRSLSPSGGGGGVEVTTSSGARHTAGQMIVAAGAWMGQMVPETKDLCVPVRQVVAWFDCPQDKFRKEAFPVFIAGELDQTPFYGFPQYGKQRGFKIGLYNHLNQVADPDAVDRAMSRDDEEALRKGVRAFFPSADGRVLAHGACMFTNTPDGHFVIDRHPRHPQVILCSACSGHGFKMSSGIGQLLAQMVTASAAGSPVCGDEGPLERELRLHRIHPDRPGHAAFLKAVGAS